MLIIVHLILIIEEIISGLGEGTTDGINDSTGAAKKNFINFSKANIKFCLSLHYSGEVSCM